jgi:hypothetical protein
MYKRERLTLQRNSEIPSEDNSGLSEFAADDDGVRH